MVKAKKRGAGKANPADKRALARARASQFRGPIPDILITALYAMGVVSGLAERVAGTREVAHARNAVRYLQRAVQNISSAASICGCGSAKPVTLRRAAR